MAKLRCDGPVRSMPDALAAAGQPGDSISAMASAVRYSQVRRPAGDAHGRVARCSAQPASWRLVAGVCCAGRPAALAVPLLARARSEPRRICSGACVALAHRPATRACGRPALGKSLRTVSPARWPWRLLMASRSPRRAAEALSRNRCRSATGGVLQARRGFCAMGEHRALAAMPSNWLRALLSASGPRPAVAAGGRRSPSDICPARRWAAGFSGR